MMVGRHAVPGKRCHPDLSRRVRCENVTPEQPNWLAFVRVRVIYPGSESHRPRCIAVENPEWCAASQLSDRHGQAHAHDRH